jgi:hypothetical protein
MKSEDAKQRDGAAPVAEAYRAIQVVAPGRLEDITQAVIGRLAACDDPRFARIMTSLVSHLHDFVRGSGVRFPGEDSRSFNNRFSNLAASARFYPLHNPLGHGCLNALYWGSPSR